MSFSQDNNKFDPTNPTTEAAHGNRNPLAADTETQTRRYGQDPYRISNVQLGVALRQEQLLRAQRRKMIQELISAKTTKRKVRRHSHPSMQLVATGLAVSNADSNAYSRILKSTKNSLEQFMTTLKELSKQYKDYYDIVKNKITGIREIKGRSDEEIELITKTITNKTFAAACRCRMNSESDVNLEEAYRKGLSEAQHELANHGIILSAECCKEVNSRLHEAYLERIEELPPSSIIRATYAEARTLKDENTSAPSKLGPLDAPGQAAEVALDLFLGNGNPVRPMPSAPQLEEPSQRPEQEQTTTPRPTMTR